MCCWIQVHQQLTVGQFALNGGEKQTLHRACAEYICQSLLSRIHALFNSCRQSASTLRGSSVSYRTLSLSGTMCRCSASRPITASGRCSSIMQRSPDHSRAPYHSLPKSSTNTPYAQAEYDEVSVAMRYRSTFVLMRFRGAYPRP